MDAKPQRPLRALKIRDENMPPIAMLPAKTLHQRNKSSPALSTLAKIGSLRQEPRRTAFADVSNTFRPLHTARDDLTLATKQKLVIVKEAEAPVEEAEVKPASASLQKAAQRPLSVSGIKGILSHLTSGSTNTATKVASHELETQPHEIPVQERRPPPSRSATAIYRESSLGLEQQIHEYPAQAAAAQDLSVGIAKALSQAKRRNTTSVSQDYSFQPLESRSTVIAGRIRPSTSSSSTYAEAQLENAQLESSGGVELPQIVPAAVMSPVEVLDTVSVYAEPLQESLPPLVELDQLLQIEEIPVKDEAKQVLSRLPSTGSNWDYLYDDAADEEDGYTTARSFKSHGDYTTSHTTTVLAPKLTARVERELAAAKRFVLMSKETAELEEDEAWDTSMVAEYGDEIFEYMRKLETQMLPNAYYMDNQTEVQWSMRSVLMDWLVQVHHRFGLLPETLFLCVNYIDRFLSCKVVSLGKLQLVGATAIFVAAKYEEINCPSVQEIVYMVDSGYTVDEILKAERFMLTMLKFELGWPGPMSFLRRISKADDYDLETRTLAKYFLEMTIMDERFVGCPPSFTAAAAHCLARLMLKKGHWSHRHAYYSGYTYSQLQHCLNAMLSCCEDPQKHHTAIFDKYADKRFKRASYFVQTEMQKGFTLPRPTYQSFVDDYADDVHPEKIPLPL